jgi:quercetin dioxygenase-like cupin family protein
MRHIKPWKYREERTMSNEQVAPETKGVTVKLLATVDLGPEIEGMAGRQLRMRMVTIEPGGVFGPIHDHKDRPGIVYILQGTITDHRNGVATDYGPGVGWPEDRNTTHWLENRGTIPAVEISVDIVRQAYAQARNLTRAGLTRWLNVRAFDIFYGSQVFESYKIF